ncbi:MAG: rhomboid family intramembrane serine protease [Lentisphaeria bacterium]|nr:rhomboid family intramembrane serine protease [Lentisphaeria bacterium]
MPLEDRDYMRGDRPPSSLDPTGTGGPSAVVPIIIANAVVFLLQIMANGELSSLFGVSFATSWQAWRVVTHLFTHDSFWMLLLNMWIFWTLGRPLERRLGVRKLLIVYAIGGLAGMVCWMVVGHGDSMLVGAGGAVGGVVVAAAVVEAKATVQLPSLALPMRSFVAVVCVVEFFMCVMTHGLSQLAQFLGGALGGFVGLRWFGTFPGRRRRRAARNEPIRTGADPAADDDLDPILDKIGRTGIDSLTAEERSTLEKARNRLMK